MLLTRNLIQRSKLLEYLEKSFVRMSKTAILVVSTYRFLPIDLVIVVLPLYITPVSGFYLLRSSCKTFVDSSVLSLFWSINPRIASL